MTRVVMLWAILILGATRSQAGGVLFFSDAAANQVIKDVIVKDGNPGIQSVFTNKITMPTGLAFAPNGNLFVASQNGNSVTKFSPDGMTSKVFVNNANGVKGPQGLAFGGAGNLYVVNNDSNVREYSPAGNLVQAFKTDTSPFGLAFDGKGNLFVATLNDKIDEFSVVAGKWAKVKVFTEAKNSDPFGIAVDKAGNVYVSNIGDNTVNVLDPATGIFSTLINKNLNKPQGLAFDSSRNLYVANQGGGMGNVLEFSVALNMGTLTATPLGPVTKAGSVKTPVYLAFAVPEPSSVVLLAVGLVGALGCRVAIKGIRAIKGFRPL
jgi:DNA-binding beta-propeller fold protein YncE